MTILAERGREGERERDLERVRGLVWDLERSLVRRLGDREGERDRIAVSSAAGGVRAGGVRERPRERLRRSGSEDMAELCLSHVLESRVASRERPTKVEGWTATPKMV